MSQLMRILEDQYSEARNHAGQKIVRRLYRGLRVEMTYAVGDVVVTITRDDTYPSREEWHTIHRHLPFLCEYKEPFQTQQKDRYILTGTFRPVDQYKF